MAFAASKKLDNYTVEQDQGNYTVRYALRERTPGVYETHEQVEVTDTAGSFVCFYTDLPASWTDAYEAWLLTNMLTAADPANRAAALPAYV